MRPFNDHKFRAGNHIFGIICPLILIGLSFLPMSLHGQDSNVIRVDFEDHGSAPPVSEWYSCIRKLDGQPTFDPAQGNRCLREILGHRKYFKSGRIEIQPSKFDLELVIFVLQSPSLKLRTIDYGIRKELQSEFRDYVTRNNLFPRIGDTYAFRDESGNDGRIENFLKSKGIMAGVSRKVILNYQTRTATLSYRIWEGPEGPVSPLLTDCDVRLTSFNLLDVDDFTPLNLILKSTYTRAGECFSESAIRSDEQALNKMKIFSEVSYIEGNGNGSGRGVSIHARTRPLVVSQISIDGFGLASTESIQKESSNFPQLPLKMFEHYRRSEAEISRKLLEAYFKTGTVRGRVFEDEEVGSDGTLKVTYHVLTWPTDELYIDGQRVA